MMVTFSDTGFFQNGLKAENASNQMEDTMNFAKRYALGTGLRVVVCPTKAESTEFCDVEDWSEGWVVYSYDTSGGLVAPKLLRRTEPGNDVAITSTLEKVVVNGLGFSDVMSVFTFQDEKDLAGKDAITLNVSKVMNIIRS